MFDATPAPPLPVRIALDACVAGSDPFAAHAPSIAAARDLCEHDPLVEIALVVPRDLMADLPAGERVHLIPATAALLSEETADVRANRLSSVRVATKAVRDGGSDIFVAGGAPGPALAAARFGFGLIQGAGAPVLAWLLATDTDPLILIGGSDEAVATCIGEVVARVLLGVAAPRVGLLASTWPVDPAGPPATSAGPPLAPSAAGLVLGSTDFDVVVTGQATAVALLDLLTATGRPAPPALVLGLGALTVLDLGMSPPGERVALAVRAVRAGLGEAVTTALGELVRQRRAAAGFHLSGPVPSHRGESST